MSCCTRAPVGESVQSKLITCCSNRVSISRDLQRVPCRSHITGGSMSRGKTQAGAGLCQHCVYSQKRTFACAFCLQVECDSGNHSPYKEDSHLWVPINAFSSMSAHRVLQLKGAYLPSLPCSLANRFALCAWISSQMAVYDLSEGCSPITQTQTSLSAPSFHVTDFPLAGKEAALWQTLFARWLRAGPVSHLLCPPGCCRWQSLSKSSCTWGKLGWDAVRASHFISWY